MSSGISLLKHMSSTTEEIACRSDWTFEWAQFQDLQLNHNSGSFCYYFIWIWTWLVDLVVFLFEIVGR